MSDAIRFRPTPGERLAIERARQRHGFPSTAEAARFLIREGIRIEKEKEDADDRFVGLRVPPHFRLKGRSITSEEIDAVVYGDHVWPGER